MALQLLISRRFWPIVSGPVREVVAAPLGKSDHSSLRVVISFSQAVPNLCVIEKQLDPSTCSIDNNLIRMPFFGTKHDLPWRNIKF